MNEWVCDCKQADCPECNPPEEEEPVRTPKPIWFRTARGNIFGWEIYSWRSFFLTIGIGSFEIQINKWRG